jgi:hypothetical protein
VTNVTLAQSYLVKATKRLRVLQVLLEEDAWSDVVREAQEVVELALKGMLRQVGIEPPKWHDVGGALLEHAARFAPIGGAELGALAAASAWLRKEREVAFYGDAELIPTEQYDRGDAERAIADAERVVAVAARVIPSPA